MTYKHHYTKTTLMQQPPQFRIEAVASDGMWLSLPKWQKLSGVTEQELTDYVDTALKNGVIVQSPTGSRSYRMPHDSIINWYKQYGFDPHGKTQLLDFVFPPRIWNGRTEPEGFLEAPVRDIGVVTFVVDHELAVEIIERLRGIAKVREYEPGRWRAYCLDANYVRGIVAEVIDEAPTQQQENTKVYLRQVSKRRELVDFDPRFLAELVQFYREFGRVLCRQTEKTMNIFIPNHDERDAQILMWVLEAIEKYDESASVPFSGYLDTVLKRWPFNLPAQHLGKELSQFQKDRAKAIEKLKKEHGEDIIFTHNAIAEKMGVDMLTFADLEEKHRAWLGAKNADSLFITDSAEERSSLNHKHQAVISRGVQSNPALANAITTTILKCGLRTGRFNDVYTISHCVDSGTPPQKMVETLSKDFVHEFEKHADCLTSVLVEDEQ